MTTVRRQGGIIQIHDYHNSITRLTENVSKTKYCIKHVENCKKLEPLRGTYRGPVGHRIA